MICKDKIELVLFFNETEFRQLAFSILETIHGVKVDDFS